jgi:hypothetical protein
VTGVGEQGERVGGDAGNGFDGDERDVEGKTDGERPVCRRGGGGVCPAARIPPGGRGNVGMMMVTHRSVESNRFCRWLRRR